MLVNIKEIGCVCVCVCLTVCLYVCLEILYSSKDKAKSSFIIILIEYDRFGFYIHFTVIKTIRMWLTIRLAFV